MATQKRTAKGTFASPEEDTEQKAKPKKKAAKRTKNCKRYAKERVKEEWPEIVKNLVSKAKKGSYNHTKLLVEVSGIKDEDVKPARGGKGGLSKMLMKKLKEKEAESKADTRAEKE